MQKTGLKSYVLIPMLFVLMVSCGDTVSKTSFQHSSGIYFDFPEGWSRLSKKEWRDMELGKQQTAVTIMDKYREASFSLIPIRLNTKSRITFRKPASGTATVTAYYVNSIHKTGPQNYEDYSLISKGKAEFAGFPMGEIFFEGQKPGKSLRWYRILVLAGADSGKSIFMLAFSAPIDEESDFESAFDFIEDRWNWDK